MYRGFGDLLIENCETYNKTNEMPFLLGLEYQKKEPVFFYMNINYLLRGFEGTGKTNILNLFILSSMFLKEEKAVLYYLFDSHHNEFKRYENFSNVKHIAYCNNLSKPLESLYDSLNKRIELFSKLRVKNIKDYNKKYTTIPYIIVVIDDFFSVNFKEKQIFYLGKILNIGKAFGINVIAATQRKIFVPPYIRSQFLEIETSTNFKTKIYTSFDTYKIVIPFMCEEKNIIYETLSRKFKK
jgi:DNA segregation ATPase FtsK/SpoIIIE-like protein